MITYNVTVSSKVPITIWYSGRGVVPMRSVVYRTPRVFTTLDNRQYGVIKYHGTRIPLVRTRKDTVQDWGQWEAIKMVDPFAYTKNPAYCATL